ncbi:MAG: hypothetical protein UE699_07160 [Bacilli bacterium]|nr:hypothetical protein [bacterium]MDY5992751.1 hypothetical protein [Bacilli bacterium]MEE0015441.1 hypothetical protein [Bacilli bacterium]
MMYGYPMYNYNETNGTSSWFWIIIIVLIIFFILFWSNGNNNCYSPGHNNSKCC